MTDPWDWYIYLHEWLIFMIFMINAAISIPYIIPYMDPMGWASMLSKFQCDGSMGDGEGPT